MARTVKLQDYDWDTREMVDVEYPSEMFEPFLEWLFGPALRNAPDVELVARKVQILRQNLAEYRQSQSVQPVQAVAQPTPPPADSLLDKAKEVMSRRSRTGRAAKAT